MPPDDAPAPRPARLVEMTGGEAVVASLLARGVDRVAAIVDAGAKRARPIVMTTLAMAAGKLPSAYGVGDGGEFRSPMAVAVASGALPLCFRKGNTFIVTSPSNSGRVGWKPICFRTSKIAVSTGWSSSTPFTLISRPEKAKASSRSTTSFRE
jgi:hypothetical protein